MFWQSQYALEPYDSVWSSRYGTAEVPVSTMVPPLAERRYRALWWSRSVSFGIGGRGPRETGSGLLTRDRIDAGSRASAAAASSLPFTFVERREPCVVCDWSPNGSGGGVGPDVVLRGPPIVRCADCVDCARATTPPAPMTAATTMATSA